MHIRGKPKLYNITEVKGGIARTRIVITIEYERKFEKMGTK